MKLRVMLAIIVCVGVVAPLQADPPPISGVVIRGETTVGYYYVDFKRAYIVVYGLDLFAICQGNPDPEVSLWDFTIADPPPDEIVHQLLKGDVVTSVWGIEALEAPCAHIPIAMGTSSVVSNLSADNVANISAHGVLTDPIDGEQMVFTSNLHCITDGYGTCIDDYHAKIILN